MQQLAAGSLPTGRVIPGPGLTLTEVINGKWLDTADALRDRYATAAPYPHIVLDNFLTEEVANFLREGFPAMEEMPTIFREPMSYKGQLSNIWERKPDFGPIFEVLQSEPFRAFLSTVTGIDQLIEDPLLAGGGLHQSPKSGFLDIHVDANFHPFEKNLHRRLNLLVYLNRDWNPAWGGQFELWSDKNRAPGTQVNAIEPLFNRAVIFSTTRTSWHGVCKIDCPPGESRKSLATWYYTMDRPEEECYRDSSVIWHQPRSTLKRLFYPLLNFGIAIAKPYARYFRRHVFDAVDSEKSGY